MKRSSLLTIGLAFCLPVALTTLAFAQDAGKQASAGKGPINRRPIRGFSSAPITFMTRMKTCPTLSSFPPK
jgi:hypothetical protein